MLSIDWFILSRIGLLYDAGGAIILVWGFMSQGKQAYREAISFYGPDEPKTVVETKVDSIVGLSFIVVGFLGQLLGSDNDIAEVFSHWGGATFALIFLVIGGVGYLVFRKLLFKHYLRHIKKTGY
jgi:hypothetical protein